MADKYYLNFGDCDTPLAENGKFTKTIGKVLKKNFEIPDVIFVSPYLRTLETLKNITKSWPELKKVKVIEDERMNKNTDLQLYIMTKIFLIYYSLNRKNFTTKKDHTGIDFLKEKMFQMLD